MTEYDEILEQEIQKKLNRKAEQLKMRYQRRYMPSFGMVASLGGVFLVPILLGIWSGGYLDEVYPQRFSWRLSLLFLGFVWGIVNAYYWLKIENEKIAKMERDINEKVKKVCDER